MSEIKVNNLDDYITQKEREEFLIVRATIIKKTEKSIEIEIEDNPETASKIAERRLISDPKKENGDSNVIRFTAGGLGIIIRTPAKNYLMTTLRISKSSFDRHLTSFTGLGYVSEIANPEKTAVRRGLEDLIIVTNDKVILPKFENNSFKDINIEAIIRDGANLRQETKDLPLKETKSEILKLRNEKDFKITWRGKKYKYHGLPVHDHGTRGLDFIKIISIELDTKIENLKFLDGRIMGGKNLLKRDVYALELDENLKWTGKISYGWKNGKIFVPPEGTSFPQTPILKSVMSSINNI
ncbi:hypothetical protein KAJ41_00330 [Candidatus Parcubacteria bacterium]|nr:hypothetical protein [Candidatus Parcubacteria bacterium]